MNPDVKPLLSDNFRGQPVSIFTLYWLRFMLQGMPIKSIEMVEVNGKKCPQIRLDKCSLFSMCNNLFQKSNNNSAFFELATTDKSTLV